MSLNQNQTLDQARAIKARYQEKLLSLANVVGVGVGFKEEAGELTDQIAVIVNVEHKKPLAELSPDDLVPPELDGMVTDVQEVGKIKAL